MRESGEIWLGRQGEKYARRLVFDCEEWLAEYTDAQIELSVTPPKGAMYFAILQEDGNKRYWDVTSADTAYDGRAYLELILRDSVTGTIIKSATAAAKISRSRSAQEPAEPPEPHVPWWERIMELIAGGSGGSGTPAVSPTITLTAIEGGTRLTVKDVNGTRSADIMNGATGPEGPQGKTGATGATGAQGVAGRGIVDITSNVYDGTPVDVKYSDGTGTVFYVQNGKDGETPDVDVFPAIDGSGTTVQIGDVSFFIPHGKDGKDGAPGESYKLTAADKDEIAEKIVEGGGVTDAQIEAAVDKYMAKNPSAGITSAQIEALDWMFSVAVYKTDPTSAYAAFKAAFGITDSTDPDEPDEPTEPDEPDKTTYAITTSLTGCTISNDAASITEGESYSATLTAADGYTLDGATVSVTMGGTDITESAYSGGQITIGSVTGDIVINVNCAQLGGTITESIPLVAVETLDNCSTSAFNGTSTNTILYRIDGVKTGDVIVTGSNNGDRPFAHGAQESGVTRFEADDSQIVGVFMDNYGWKKYTFTAAQDYDVFWVHVRKDLVGKPSFTSLEAVVTWTHEK